MSLEDRIATLEVDMEDVKTLLASAARHIESASAVADRNAIAIQDHRQDITRLDQRLDRHITAGEETRQRLDEFVFQAQRLIGDHGGRLERVEASLETLVSLAQNQERRLTAREDSSLRVESTLETLAAITQGHGEQLAQLVTLAQNYEERLANTETRLSQVDERLERVSLNLEAVADGLRSLEAGLNRLEAIQENHLRREHGQGDG